MKENILKVLEDYYDSLKEIWKVFGIGENYFTEISDDLEKVWSINEDTLWIANSLKDFEDGNYYEYTISSEGAKGEKLYKGQKDNVMYVMAYVSEDNWYDSIIMMLDISKQLSFEKIEEYL